MSNLLKKVGEAIHSNFLAKTPGEGIAITESNAKAVNKKFVIKSNAPHLTVFLDQKRGKGTGHPAFSSLNPACSGMTSAADAIVICHPKDDESKYCAFLVELKSNNNTGSSDQIRSSRAFVRWVFELLEIHHGIPKDIPCFGLVVLSRRIPQKGTTRKDKLIFSQAGTGSKGISIAKWSTDMDLHLSQMIKSALG